MSIWLSLALLFAVLEAIAVSKNIRQLEYIAKPAVMICLFLWLYASTGLQGQAFWFGLGILLSLIGDVLLMFSLDRLFLFGLVAFLFTHIFYLAGLREELIDITAWPLILVILIAFNAGYFLWRIAGAMRGKGQNKLIIPVILYGIVISVMLCAALATIDNPAWKASAALLTATGAFLFVTSDAILAWNKFVTPLKNGRTWNIALYHLGQIGLIAGVISQYG